MAPARRAAALVTVCLLLMALATVSAAPSESLLSRSRKLLQITIRGADGGCSIAIPYRASVGNFVGGNWGANLVTLGRGSPRCNPGWGSSWWGP
ncbi:hypothetical protein Rsub_05792 [Raphidocelis subcapitata]|uniref:Uncharacterized protein n=1 Tax=Raphidocelis subcapitata TaxID=307507 RepID=A0A2V0NZB5_9CHLO|nr:hypothetical protein Rsub_05792 [Raphidocelis subcapitata]|eukprot:GBF92956.1 hypothetical protein Rsub_05792 [Raphidocelis subcapitata]